MMNIEIIPNYHPILVHFTIGLLSISALLYLAGSILSEAAGPRAMKKGSRPSVCRSPAGRELGAACHGPWRAPLGRAPARRGRGHRNAAVVAAASRP